MIRAKAVGSPTLDANGRFPIRIDEFAYIQRDPVKKNLTTGTATTNIITMPDTAGLAVGQTIVVRDSLNNETLIITAVTPGVQITTATNLVNTYTVARGGTVTVVDITLPMTGTATGGLTVIPMTNTTGLRAGQALVIEDSAGAEANTVNVVTPGVQITVVNNLANTYTVARGGKVTIVNGNPARAKVNMQKPFVNLGGAPPLGAEFLDLTWSTGVNTLVVTVEKADPSAGPALPYNWVAALTADVAGLQFAAIADGE